MQNACKAGAAAEVLPAPSTEVPGVRVPLYLVLCVRLEELSAT